MVDRQAYLEDMDAWHVRQDPLTAEALLETLFDAAASTFHDADVLRSMVYVLGALRRSDECELAMRAYLQLSIHAFKTTGVVEAHVHTTAHQAVTLFTRAYLDNKADASLALEFAETVQAIQKDNHLLGRAKWVLCLHGRLPWSAVTDLLQPSCELVFALVASEGRGKALGVLKQVLQQPSNGSLLMLGNLLCAEEQYERAMLAFSQVQAQETFDEKRQVIQAQLAMIDVTAILQGPSKALDKAKDVFLVFSTLFGAQQSTPSVPAILEPAREASRSVTPIPPTNGHRSSSLHLKPPRAQPSLLLRKSASARSLLHRHRHVSAPVQVQEVLHMADVPLQEGPQAYQQRLTKELLATCWLRVARYAREADLQGDALQALAEAQSVAGPTSAVLLEQCHMNIAFKDAARSQIEARFEILLQRDDAHLEAAIAFAQFLMQQDTPAVARAYDLLAPWTTCQVALQPELWTAFGGVCEARGEDARAREAYWRAVELADVQGVLPWMELAAAL